MKAFFGTTLGKVIIGVLAAAVVAGGGYGVYRAVQSEPAPVAAITDPAEEITTTEAIITTEAETTTKEESTEAPTAAPAAATTTTTKATTKQSGVVELSPIMYEPFWPLAEKLGFMVPKQIEDDGGFVYTLSADNRSSLYRFVKGNVTYYEVTIATPSISFYGQKIDAPLDITKIPARLYDDVRQSDTSYQLEKGDIDKYSFGIDENGVVTMMMFRYTVQ